MTHHQPPSHETFDAHNVSCDFTSDGSVPQLESALELATLVVGCSAVNLTQHCDRTRFDHFYGSRHDPTRYVLRDVNSGLYIKVQPMDEARLQQRVMNTLHDRFEHAGLGVSAVRYLALVSGGPNGTTIGASVIEPASGKALSRSYRGLDREPYISEARRRIRKSLGLMAAHILVNDTKDGNNLFYREDDDHYVVIDQPFIIPYDDREHPQMEWAMKRLDAKTRDS